MKPTVALFGLSGGGAGWPAGALAGSGGFFIETFAPALALGAVTLTVSPPVPALASSLSGGPMLSLKLTGSKSLMVRPFAVCADAPGAVPGDWAAAAGAALGPD
jgi:hypothetical protein